MQFSLTQYYRAVTKVLKNSEFFKIAAFVKITKVLEIYTDGSSKGAYGSWAYVISRSGKCISESSGRIRRANSNTMEFQAAIEALTAIPVKSRVILYSDSRVVVDTMKFGNGPRAHEVQIESL